ncbi:MAG TPA: FHA domain-containing protein [Candidatus Limnocylindrales bacterium]|nr:FHA domain-containing protein [Candidatus Limnocylindrales bacterium]
MEPLTRCSNGHYYDSKKHASCPFCGVKNLDLDIKKTMAKRPESGGGISQQAVGKTVGVFHKKMGMDPVVGWLVAIAGPEKGRDFRITSEKNFIGRSEKMDINLAGDESVSRENHAVISYNPKNHTFRLFPGESRGLVYHNDEEVVTPETLKPNDIIELGQSRLMFVPFCGDRFQWKEEEGQQ